MLLCSSVIGVMLKTYQKRRIQIIPISIVAVKLGNSKLVFIVLLNYNYSFQRPQSCEAGRAIFAFSVISEALNGGSKIFLT